MVSSKTDLPSLCRICFLVLGLVTTLQFAEGWMFLQYVQVGEVPSVRSAAALPSPFAYGGLLVGFELNMQALPGF